MHGKLLFRISVITAYFEVDARRIGVLVKHFENQTKEHTHFYDSLEQILDRTNEAAKTKQIQNNVDK